MKIVVTGAAGRIGSCVCGCLHAAGYEVRAVDRDVARWCRTASPKSIVSAEEAFAYIDLADVGRLVEACLKADVAGYRQYFAVAQDEAIRRELPEIVAEHYSGVPVRGEDPLKTLVDISEITRDTGWTPLVNRLPGALTA